MTSSSRRNAQTWPYPRHRDFEAQLRESNARWFAERRLAVNPRMPYLLARWEDWRENIILPEVVEYIDAELKDRSEQNQGFPLHMYIHHGLSSQAMLFNLIGPLVARHDLSPLQKAFQTAGIPWPAGDTVLKFEVEDRDIFIEDTGQPTSIDLAIRGQAGSRTLFVEAKLVEREFGGCSVFENGDCDGRNPSEDFELCYLHHLGRRYWELLDKHGFLNNSAFSGRVCPLASYYQFFRELLFAVESGGEFVLLYDERNPAFYVGATPNQRGLMPFLLPFVPAPLQPKVHKISIQQVVGAFHEFGDNQWLGEFEKKYALSTNPIAMGKLHLQ